MNKQELDNITDFLDTQPTKKTNGRRNKQAGSSHELNVAKKLHEHGFPHVITTRLGSRLLDSQKVDLMNKDEYVQGRLPYNIQCKTLAKLVHYGKVLDEMPQKTPQINVVIHKQTKKVGEKFMPRGTYAIMDAEDFYDIAQTVENYKVLVAKINTMT